MQLTLVLCIEQVDNTANSRPDYDVVLVFSGQLQLAASITSRPVLEVSPTSSCCSTFSSCSGQTRHDLGPVCKTAKYFTKAQCAEYNTFGRKGRDWNTPYVSHCENLFVNVQCVTV